MPVERSAEADSEFTEWNQQFLGESYTQAFNIRKVMYRIQDVDLPFKRGLRVEQFIAFLATIFGVFIVINLFIQPLLNLAHIGLPFQVWLLIYLAPPIFLAMRVGKPMPYNKTIPGTVLSFLRYHLDDRWHRRGIPVSKAPDTGVQGNVLRTWTVDPAFACIEEKDDLPATSFDKYTHIDIPEHTVRIPGEEEEKKASIIEDEETFINRVLVTDDVPSTVVEPVIVDSDVEEIYVPVLDRSKVSYRSNN